MELSIDQALQQGVAAHREGKLQDAERFYRAVLRAQPDHPDANHNLGVLAVSVGRPQDAVPLFKLALKANPKAEQFWLSYIEALIKAERFDQATQALERAIQTGINGSKLSALRAQLSGWKSTTKKKGRTHPTLYEKRKKIALKKASKKRRKREVSGKLAPTKHQEHHLIKLYQSGQADAAKSLAESITMDFPDYALGWKVLGTIHIQKSCFVDAEASLRRSIELSPQDAESHNNLGNSLKGLGRHDEASLAYRQAIALDADYADAYNNLGLTLEELGRLGEAESNLRKAVSLQPERAEIHLNLGVTLRISGKLAEAQAVLKQALVLKPDCAYAHRALAGGKKFIEKDEHYRQMLALYKGRGLSPEDHGAICFALAKASDDMGDFGSAFNFYEEGNSVCGRSREYNEVKEAASFKNLKVTSGAIAAQALPKLSGAERPKPIFIVGMPRSGTTLVEQIISSHPLVTGAGELAYVAQFGSLLAHGQTPVQGKFLKTFRERYLNALLQHSEGKSVVTDKMPLNFRFLGLIAIALPEAKIVHVKRNPAAICWANYTQYFFKDALNYSYKLDNILQYLGLYEDLMGFWHQAFPGKIYDLDYERLTANPGEETRKLISHLRLDWDDSCLSPEDNKRGVATASNLQVRQRVYQGSSEKWKRYRPYLDGALDHFSAGNN